MEPPFWMLVWILVIITVLSGCLVLLTWAAYQDWRERPR